MNICEGESCCSFTCHCCCFFFVLIAEDMSSVTNVFSYSITISGIVIGICPAFTQMRVVRTFLVFLNPLRKYSEPLDEYRHCYRWKNPPVNLSNQRREF